MNKKIVDMDDDFDMVVCSGGDGTLDEVVTGMMARNKRVPIGYIPAGTTNDFAKTLKLSMDPLRSARTIIEASYMSCDAGMLNEMNFVYVAAFGTLSDVSYSTPQATKNILGASAYVLEGIKQLFDLKKYKMKLESGCDGGCVINKYDFEKVMKAIGGCIEKGAI